MEVQVNDKNAQASQDLLAKRLVTAHKFLYKKAKERLTEKERSQDGKQNIIPTVAC